MFYYTSDGSKFFSKLKALEYAKKNNHRIWYYYYDAAYSKVNWKVEPQESLQFHYKAQAERLREKYDYLILCYSGGYDSTNILETFHFNNIKLDKIIIVGAFSQDAQSGSDSNHNGELYFNAFPYINELGLASITEKHDYAELFSDESNFSLMQYDHDWIDYTGSWFSPHNWFWRDIEKHIVPKNIGSKKVGLIFGRDKPSLHSDSFCFTDTPLNSYGNSVGTMNCDRINFYWDPEYPEILLKQLHVLKRLKTREYKYDVSLGAQMFGDLDVNSIIYDLKKPLLFKSPKSKSTLLSARDLFLGNARSTSLFKRYSSGITNLYSRVGTQKLQTINSRLYYL